MVLVQELLVVQDEKSSEVAGNSCLLYVRNAYIRMGEIEREKDGFRLEVKEFVAAVGWLVLPRSELCTE